MNQGKPYLTHCRALWWREAVAVVMVCAILWTTRAVVAQVPDRPIITEIFNNPEGADGPTGRNVGNPDQEFVEIYIPAAARLNPLLDKDRLRLTFLEVEGDFTNAQSGHVTQRIDLPTIDADPGNGLAPGSIARPLTGVVVLGWVDYNTFDPPTALAGTFSSRVALIDSGVTASPPGAMFIAVNGNQFGGTANFTTPASVSFIDVPNENRTGILRNGSNAYLLVNRDDPGYVRLEDRKHPELGASDASLATGTVLRLSALFDGFAGNDDPLFVTSSQPRVPAGVDLDTVLPLGGVFSVWIAQVAEQSGRGYARRFVDRLKSTEDGVAGNEDPVSDASGHYRRVFRNGPFVATPGAVVFSGDAPALGVASPSRLVFNVLAGTTGRPGLICANVGGDFPIDVAATPGASSNAAVAQFSGSFDAVGVGGQRFGYPQISVSVPAGAAHGSVVTAPVSFQASNANPSDPPVLSPFGTSSVQATVLNPTRGQNASGLPFQATVFAALVGSHTDVANPNPLRASDLGGFVVARLGHSVLASLGNADALLAADTALGDFPTVEPLIHTYPASEALFIDAAGPPGLPGLAQTVVQSPKNLLTPQAYAPSLNASHTAVRALEIPIPETLTAGGLFSPSEFLFFASAIGGEFDRRDGLGWATTDRTFELAVVDSNVTAAGIESGTGDDFGLVVEVGQVRVGSVVQPGEFLFLSYTGGLAGEDIDGTQIPGDNEVVTVLLDLDNLDTVLGCESITRLFIVDAAGSDVLDTVEVLSLNPRCASTGACPFFGDGNRDGQVNAADNEHLAGCIGGPNSSLSSGVCDAYDPDGDMDVDLRDISMLLGMR